MASAILASVSIAGRPSPAPPSITPFFAGRSRDLLVGVVGDAPWSSSPAGRSAARCWPSSRRRPGSRARPRRSSASSGPGRPRTSPARQSSTRPPGCAVSPGVSCCSGTATTSRRTPRWVRASSENAAADRVEGVEVGARLEGRVDRRVEGVHERMHVGGVEVVLLVPGGGGQHDVRQQGGAGHPEVQRQQQVELAARRLVVAPGDVARPAVGRRLLRLQVVVRAEQVLAGSTRRPWPRSRAGWPATASGSAASSPARPGPRWRTAGVPSCSCVGDVGAATSPSAAASSATSRGLRSNCG